MIQAVVLKSNKYGINLILDPELPFGELLEAIKQKFRDSDKFFKNAQVAISFEGRTLSQEEENEILEAISENSSVQIICIVDNDSNREEQMKRQIDAYYEAASAAQEYEEALAGSDGEFYRGTLRSGQVLESISSVVVVGDVNPGAKVVSQGNVVILGSLKGNAYAGAAGNDKCFIVALDMDPIQLQISDVLAKSPDKQKIKKRVSRRKPKQPAIDPQIAMLKNGNIYIEPVTKGLLNNI